MKELEEKIKTLTTQNANEFKDKKNEIEHLKQEIQKIKAEGDPARKKLEDEKKLLDRKFETQRALVKDRDEEIKRLKNNQNA